MSGLGTVAVPRAARDACERAPPDDARPTRDVRLEEGERVGRFVVVRDVEGRIHALAAGSVAAVCETDDGALLMLPGGRMVHVPRPLRVVLDWLDGRGPG